MRHNRTKTCILGTACCCLLLSAQVDPLSAQDEMQPLEVLKLLAADAAAGDHFGYRVAIQGNTAIVSAGRDEDNGDDSGSAYVFESDGSDWVQTQKLLPSDGDTGDWFSSYGLAFEGDLAVITSCFDDDKGAQSGSAYIFRHDGSSWAQEAKLVAQDGDAGDAFGCSAAISGNVVVIGAEMDEHTAYNAGSAYVFRYKNESWAQEAKLLPGDGIAHDLFGNSVAIDGDTIVVGAFGHFQSRPGRAYVFHHENGIWSQQQTLVGSDAAARDEFGSSVSISGELLVVGAHQWGNSGKGKAYVYRHDGASWTEEAILVASDGAVHDIFGISVTVSPDERIVVGAAQYYNAGPGAAYVFDHDGAAWIEKAKLTASDGASLDTFGNGVAISGDMVLVGAANDDDLGSTTGAAYLFSVADDHDSDGIYNLVDGEIADGTFVDQSAVFSDHFTDQHLGGTSFGYLHKRVDGLVVTVTDAPDPAGLRAEATGGAGTALVKACGLRQPVKLTSGDIAEIGCSPLILRVLVGPVEIELSEVGGVTVPTGATVAVTDLGDEQVEIENQSPGGTPPVLIAIGTEVIELDPGATQVVCSVLPIVIPPAPITLECSSQGGNPASDTQLRDWLNSAAAYSPCGDATLSDDAPAFFFLGATTVSFSALDAFGSVVTAGSTATILDTTPPDVFVSLSPDTLWPPNHRMIDVEAAVMAGDVCSTPNVVLTSVTSNEADNGEGDGNTVDDIHEAAPGTPDPDFKLRAERADGGSGRIYTAIYTATDDSGNATSEAGFVVVPHDQGGVAEPLEVLLEENANGTLLQWNVVPGAESYNVIRGQLSNIVDVGVVHSLGVVTCIEANSIDENTAGQEDPELPGPGTSFFYLVEYDDGTSSSYGTVSADKPRAPGPGDCE